MLPFRISVSLNSLFNDQRSLSYVLIDNRFQTIEDLENHIKSVFKLKPECNICLISNNHLLPPTEKINLIHEGDSLHVSPVNNDFCLRAKSHVIQEEDLQPPIKKRKTNKKNPNAACISIEDSSDEKDILKVEPEFAPQAAKKKKKKKSVQFGDTFTNHDTQNDTQKMETNESVATEVDTLEQRNVTDNKNIQILNIENVSNMKLDTINSTNLESKIDENEVLFCSTECSNSNIYKNEASTSKHYALEISSKFSNTEYTNSKIDKYDSIAPQSFDVETNSKFSNAENITSKFHDTECSTSRILKNISASNDSGTTSKLCNSENNTIYKNDTYTSKIPDLGTSSKLCESESTSKIIADINNIIKNDNTTNVNENESIVKNCDTSNEFIEHLRLSNNGSRGKIPPFTVGDFLHYAHKIGNKHENNVENNNINSPSTVHVTKRRRRVRKRKSRCKDENSSINSMSDVEFEFRQPLKTASPRLHIRFDNEDKNSSETMSNASPMCSSTPNQDTTKFNIKKDKNETVLNNNVHNSIKENSITESEIDITLNNFGNNLPDVNDNYFKNIDLTNNNLENIKNVKMNKDVTPKINNIIAFKTYEFNEKYEPSISNWIVGKILKWYATDKHVDVFILAGQIKTNVANGKFELENNWENEGDQLSNKNERRENEDERKSKPSSIVNLNFTELIDPRLLIIVN